MSLQRNPSRNSYVAAKIIYIYIYILLHTQCPLQRNLSRNSYQVYSNMLIITRASSPLNEHTRLPAGFRVLVDSQ